MMFFSRGYQRLLCDHHFVLTACRYCTPSVGPLIGMLRCFLNEPFSSWRGRIGFIPYPYVFPFDRHICPSPIAILHGVRRWLFIPMSIRHKSSYCMVLRCPFILICRNVYNRQFSRLLHILLHRYVLYRACGHDYRIC